MTTVLSGAAVNPFSTRYHAPGALAYCFEDDEGGETSTAEALYEKFLASGRCGEIVGPHGTGKTTLLCALEAEARWRGHAPRRVTLREEERRLPVDWWRFEGEDATKTPAERVVFLDGAEQLSRLGFWRVQRRCRREGFGLLVTAHRSLGLPALYRTLVSETMARRLAERILASCPQAPRLVAPDEAAAALQAAHGDLRAALFALYDLYEKRSAARRTQRSGPWAVVRPSRPVP